MRTFDQYIDILNTSLTEKEPKIICASWVYRNNPSVYRYVWKNIKTETGHVDWDRVTCRLDRSFQRRWVRHRQKQVKLYKEQSEVDIVLNRYKDKLYTFICAQCKEDREIKDRIVIRLVRVSQRGNILAQAELVKWINYTVDEWIDRYPQICKWKGYRDEADEHIKRCIRCYRYTGSFLGYLFRTLEYSARGKPPLASLDDKFCDGEMTRIDFITANNTL